MAGASAVLIIISNIDTQWIIIRQHHSVYPVEKGETNEGAVRGKKLRNVRQMR